jgi:hypothetical protein
MIEVITGKQKKKVRAVIYGPEGIGKSTMASQFPKPLFIDIEGGTHALDVARVQAPKSWAGLMQMLDSFSLGHAPAGYQTLVIDTADWSEKMLKEAICQEAGVAALGDVAYGTLYQKLGAKWGKMLDTLALIAERMHVVLLAHSQLSHCEIPEESGSFDRYELKLNQSFKVNTASMTKEWASMVLILNYEVIVVETDGKTKAQGGRRVCFTTHHACWDAKNRYDLPEKIRLPENGELPVELAKVLSDLEAPETAVPATPAAPAVQTQQQQPQPAAPAVSAPATTPAPTEQKPEYLTPDKIPAEKARMLVQLSDLMKMSDIQFKALDLYLSKKGVVPAGTNPRNYNESTLQRIINGWQAVSSNIKKQQA